MEAFPSQKEIGTTYWYEPYKKLQKTPKSSEKKSKGTRDPQQGHRGAYYNSYKFWKQFFKQSGLCDCDEDSENEDDGPTEESDDSVPGIIYIILP